MKPFEFMFSLGAFMNKIDMLLEGVDDTEDIKETHTAFLEVIKKYARS